MNENVFDKLIAVGGIIFSALLLILLASFVAGQIIDVIYDAKIEKLEVENREAEKRNHDLKSENLELEARKINLEIERLKN